MDTPLQLGSAYKHNRLLTACGQIMLESNRIICVRALKPRSFLTWFIIVISKLFVRISATVRPLSTRPRTV